MTNILRQHGHSHVSAWPVNALLAGIAHVSVQIHAWTFSSHGAKTSLKVADVALQVERAKKCLDFAATCYVLHLAIVSMVGGFPRTPTW